MADHTTRGATPAPHVSTAGALRADIDRVLSAHSGPTAAPQQAPAAADPLLPGLDTSRPLDVLLHKLELLRSALLGFRLAARSFEHRISAAEAQETFGGMFEALWALLPDGELTEAVYGVALDMDDSTAEQASEDGAAVHTQALALQRATPGLSYAAAVKRAAESGAAMAPQGGWFGLPDDDAVFDVACARNIIRKATGNNANTLFARFDVLARVATSPAVRAYLPPAQHEPATTVQMARIFDVQRIEIVDSVPADLGANGQALGEAAALAYVPAHELADGTPVASGGSAAQGVSKAKPRTAHARKPAAPRARKAARKPAPIHA